MMENNFKRKKNFLDIFWDSRKLKISLLIVVLLVGIFLIFLIRDDDSELTSLEFWGFYESEIWQDYWAGAIQRFEEKNPGIKVSYSPGELDDPAILEKLEIAHNSGAIPDIFVGAIFKLAKGVEEGWFEPLDGYIETWEDSEDIIQEVYDRGTYNGIVYGIAHQPDALLNFYRKDYFREAGLDPENPPETWEELADAAVRLTKYEDGEIVRSGFNIPSDQFVLFVPFVRQNGGDFIDDQGNPAIDSPEWIETLEFFTDLVKDKKVNKITDWAESRANNQFIDGAAAISLLFPFQIKEFIVNNPHLEDEIGTLKIRREQRSEWSGALFPYMSSVSKNKNASWEFIKFIFEPEEMWIRYEETNTPIVRKSLEEEYLEDSPLLNGVMWDGIQVGEGASKVIYQSEMNFQIQQAMEEAFHTDKTPEQALIDAKERLDKIINESEDG